jgi:hypothetical protein
MNEGSKKITLPKDLQMQMLKFFLKTSIPRSKRNSDNPLSKILDEEKPQ